MIEIPLLIPWWPLDGLLAALTNSTVGIVCVMFLMTTLVAEFATRILHLNRSAALVLAGFGFATAAQSLLGIGLSGALGVGLETVAMIMMFEVGQWVSL